MLAKITRHFHILVNVHATDAEMTSERLDALRAKMDQHLRSLPETLGNTHAPSNAIATRRLFGEHRSVPHVLLVNLRTKTEGSRIDIMTTARAANHNLWVRFCGSFYAAARRDADQLLRQHYTNLLSVTTTWSEALHNSAFDGAAYRQVLETIHSQRVVQTNLVKQNFGTLDHLCKWLKDYLVRVASVCHKHKNFASNKKLQKTKLRSPIFAAEQRDAPHRAD